MIKILANEVTISFNKFCMLMSNLNGTSIIIVKNDCIKIALISSNNHLSHGKFISSIKNSPVFNLDAGPGGNSLLFTMPRDMRVVQKETAAHSIYQ